MTAYTFRLYDNTDSTVEGILPNVIAADESEVLIGEHALVLRFDPYNDRKERLIGQYPEDDGLGVPLLAVEKYIHARNNITDEERSFIIRSLETSHSGNDLIYIVQCEHIKYELRDTVSRANGEWAQISAQEFLSEVFTGVTAWTVSTNQIPAADLRNMEAHHPTLLEALKLVCDTWTEDVGGTEKRFYYTITKATPNVINIYREDNLGSDVDRPLIYRADVRGITKDTDGHNLANRIFSAGLDNSIAYADNAHYSDIIAGTILYVFAGHSAVYTLDDLGADGNPVGLKTYISIYLRAGVFTLTSGYCYIIYRVQVLTSADAVLYTADFNSPDIAPPDLYLDFWKHINVGQLNGAKKVKLYAIGYYESVLGASSFHYIQKRAIDYELAPNTAYVEDPTSQSNYGLVEASIENTDHPYAINIIRDFKMVGGSSYSLDATFSGTYPAGLNDMLTAVGSITPTENTDTAYIIHGTKSQKIVANTKVAGVKFIYSGPISPVKMIDGVFYHCIFNLYIVEGQLSVYIECPAYPPSATLVFQALTQGLGWVQIVSDTPFGTDETGVIAFWLLADSNTAEFYLDSVMIAQSSEQVPFYKANAADELKIDMQRVLNLNLAPRVSYTVDLESMVEIDPQLADYKFDVGDNVRVIDDDASLNQQVKVISSKKNLLRPQERQIVLADRTRSLAESITILSGTKNVRIL